MSFKCLLQVTIIDVNDQEPTFDRLVYYVDPIEENNDIGAAIVQVKAIDRDVETNAIVQVGYWGLQVKNVY